MRDREAEIRELFPLVRLIARRMKRLIPTCDADDLAGDGSIGLIQAVDSYDPARGIPLHAYARKIIAGAMLNGIRRMDTVSERTRRTIRRAEAARIEHAQATGHMPSLREMEAVFPGLARARAKAYRNAPLSLDGPLPSGEPWEADSFVDPLQVVISRADRDAIARTIAALPPRQRRIVVLHYWRGMSLRVVSEQMMISPQRVSQMHVAALRRMRATFAHDGR